MTERKSEINSLVPKKEASLVLVSNSLQITNKLLSESKFQFYWDFQAKLKLSYELDNSKKFIHPFIDTKNNFFKTLYSDGRVIKYSLFDGQKLEEKKELQEYLNAN